MSGSLHHGFAGAAERPRASEAAAPDGLASAGFASAGFAGAAPGSTM